MAKKLAKNKVYWLHNSKNRKSAMLEPIKVLFSYRHRVAGIMLIGSFLEVVTKELKLSSESKRDGFFKKYFPSIAKRLSFQDFKDFYRNALVHSYNLAKGYGLGQDSKMHGRYWIEKEVGGRLIAFLNADLVRKDFEKMMNDVFQ